MEQPLGKDAGNGAFSLVIEENRQGNVQVNSKTRQWTIGPLFP